jgi:peptide/nickel transport system substrate-binding protein
MISGLGAGTIDITDPSFSSDAYDEICSYNSNGEVTGDKITTSTVDNLGYGYIGINADTVNVGGDPDSDASKDLRRALATVIAVYRDLAIDSYYGERAVVINYTISNTSWAAPQKTDEGYQIANSNDVDGNPIYTSTMTDDDKYTAALQAAVGYLEAAGFTYDGSKFTPRPKARALSTRSSYPATAPATTRPS